jgi:hypothetical protein
MNRIRLFVSFDILRWNIYVEMPHFTFDNSISTLSNNFCDACELGRNPTPFYAISRNATKICNKNLSLYSSIIFLHMYLYGACDSYKTYSQSVMPELVPSSSNKRYEYKLKKTDVLKSSFLPSHFPISFDVLRKKMISRTTFEVEKCKKLFKQLLIIKGK